MAYSLEIGSTQCISIVYFLSIFLLQIFTACISSCPYWRFALSSVAPQRTGVNKLSVRYLGEPILNLCAIGWLWSMHKSRHSTNMVHRCRQQPSGDVAGATTDSYWLPGSWPEEGMHMRCTAMVSRASRVCRKTRLASQLTFLESSNPSCGGLDMVSS